MNEDPIVEEVRRAREKYAAAFARGVGTRAQAMARSTESSTR
jgi:hypothetical protein